MGSWAVRALAVLVLGAIPLSAAWGDVFDFTRVADTTTPVPGGFGNFTSVRLLAVDGANIAFVGSYTIGQTNHSGLYQSHNGQIDRLIDHTTAAPSGGSFQSILAGNEYLSGNLVFGANTTSGIGIFRFAGGGVQTVVAPGTSLPAAESGGGILTALESKGVGGDANNAVFAGTSSNGEGILYQVVGNQVQFLANATTRVPGHELGTFHAFPEASHRNGKTLFVGTALDPDAGAQIFEPAGVFYNLAQGGLHAAVTNATLIPEFPQFYFREFENPRIGDDGFYYFTGGFLEKEKARRPGAAGGRGGTEPDHFMGVFVVDHANNITTIVDSEMELPGLKGEIEEFNRYSFDGGARVFGVNDVNGNSYLYLQDGPGGDFIHVLDSTEMFDGKQLTQLRMTLDPAADGVISFRAAFADGSSGIYTFAVPEPASGALVLAAALLAMRRGSRKRAG